MIQTIDPAAAERTKYAQIWSEVPTYKDNSPGLQNVDRFMKVMKPKPGSTLLDIGCGAGVAGLAFQERGLKVWYTDLTDAGLEDGVPRDRFVAGPLWAPLSDIHSYVDPYDYGFCCDVMEHIPPEYTMLVLDRIITSCAKTWMQICNVEDNFGKTIGKPLHLTVRSFTWWRDRIASLGTLIEARDLCGNSLFVVSRP